jgi:hypothetical protein
MSRILPKIRLFCRQPRATRTVSRFVIEEIPYRISLETNEIILDPENIKRIKGANDNPVAKQQREDLRFVSPALAKKLRDENFKK